MRDGEKAINGRGLDLLTGSAFFMVRLSGNLKNTRRFSLSISYGLKAARSCPFLEHCRRRA